MCVRALVCVVCVCVVACISKSKGRFLYSAVSSPLDHSTRFTCFASPGRPVHSDTNSAFPGSILARQQLRAKAKSLTFPPLSIARYSFIQLSQLGPQWRELKCPIFETVMCGCMRAFDRVCVHVCVRDTYMCIFVWVNVRVKVCV